jgi:hypothetical protein
VLNPRTPKSQCCSALVSKSDVGGWFLSFIGATAPQVTFTVNIELWGRGGCIG